MQAQFDVVVIGGGHAGCEAAAAAARMGARTALVTHRFATIGAMSCNPAIGGLGKGHLVREIDALDGLMGRVADRGGIQFRVLNKRKGPAVRGPRAQADRKLYAAAMQEAVGQTPNLQVIESEADDLLSANGRVTAVKLVDGRELGCGAAVLTTGTFLRGLIHIGEKQIPAGRAGETPALGLSRTLENIGFVLGRLKTGTPPRLDGRSIDWVSLEMQPGDDPPEPFSMLTTRIDNPQIRCGITRTNEATHKIIRDNVHRSPMYPDKSTAAVRAIVRRSKTRSSSSPTRWAPDFSGARRVSTSRRSIQMESRRRFPKTCSTLWSRPFAGWKRRRSFVLATRSNTITSTHANSRRRWRQNVCAVCFRRTDQRHHRLRRGCGTGTSWWSQCGVTPGNGQDIIFDRAQAYIGVMIDDLVTRGVSEPYRMFTSRAEYRLALRADNADQRLTAQGIAIGCVGEKRRKVFDAKNSALNDARQFAKSVSLTPKEAERHGLTLNKDGQRRSAFELLSHPNISVSDLKKIWPRFSRFRP